MYESHWLLDSRPFDDTNDERRFFGTPTHTEGLARLVYLIRERRSGGCLIGPHGIGKSLLLHSAVAQTAVEGRLFIRLSAGPGDALTLAQRIGDQIGARSEADNLPATLRDLERAIRDASAQDFVILLDDAQALRDATAFDALHFIATTLEQADRRTTVILAGTEMLAAQLSTSSSAIAQQMQLTWRLAPLSLAETNGYIRHRLAAAGRFDDPFDQSAIYLLHERSRGIPRVINQLADLALLHGFQTKAARVDSELILRAIAEKFPQPPAPIASVADTTPSNTEGSTPEDDARQPIPHSETYVWE
jgi:type II secretory pathway predicted ATPase ExeA